MQLLFVCTGNTCRSPMAAAYAADRCRRAGRDDISVRSAGLGTFAGSPASEPAQEVMREWDIDLSDFRSTRFSVPLADASDRIIAMTARHRDAIVNALPEAASRTVTLLGTGDVADPYGGSVADYRRTFDEMRPALDRLLDQILNTDDNITDHIQ